MESKQLAVPESASELERESACVSVRDDKRSARSGKYLAAGSRIDQRPTPPPLHRVEQCFPKGAPHHVPASSTVLLRDETNMYLLPPGLFWPGCSDHSALALQSTPPSVDHAGNEGNTPGYCLSQYLTTSFNIERACQHAHEGCWLQSSTAMHSKSTCRLYEYVIISNVLVASNVTCPPDRMATVA